jgi:hypothetical protein
MQPSFFGYYRPTDEELGELWRNSLIVLDANVLLNLYRYPNAASADLLAALTQVKDRLFVAYQAALEYQENRLAVVAEQVTRFDEVRAVLTNAQNSLRAGLDQLQLKKRHSSIAPDELLAGLAELVERFMAQLSNLEKAQAGVSDSDALRDGLDTLLHGRIGPPPSSQEELDRIYKSGKERYEVKRPPGYMDANAKTNQTYTYGGLTFRGEFGDLLVWEQTIEAAKAEKAKHLIFITDDEKEDWWWIVDSKGKKTIGPRPELVEEMRRRGGVSGFHMYTSERFLKYAKDFLGTQIKVESIQQVRDVRSQRITQSIPMFSDDRRGLDAVEVWLKSRYVGDDVSRGPGRPDFLVLRRDGTSLGFEVIDCLRNFSEAGRQMLRNFLDASGDLHRTSAGNMTLIFLASDDDDAALIGSHVLKVDATFPCVVGVISTNERHRVFKPIYSVLPGTGMRPMR